MFFINKDEVPLFGNQGKENQTQMNPPVDNMTTFTVVLFTSLSK